MWQKGGITGDYVDYALSAIEALRKGDIGTASGLLVQVGDHGSAATLLREIRLRETMPAEYGKIMRALGVHPASANFEYAIRSQISSLAYECRYVALMELEKEIARSGAVLPGSREKFLHEIKKALEKRHLEKSMFGDDSRIMEKTAFGKPFSRSIFNSENKTGKNAIKS